MLIETITIIVTVLGSMIGGVWYLSGQISLVSAKLDTLIDSHQREHDIFYQINKVTK